jgi:hypothetical protein
VEYVEVKPRKDKFLEIHLNKVLTSPMPANRRQRQLKGVLMDPEDEEAENYLAMYVSHFFKA